MPGSEAVQQFGVNFSAVSMWIFLGKVLMTMNNTHDAHQRKTVPGLTKVYALT